mgnify:CR=1 FL=1
MSPVVVRLYAISPYAHTEGSVARPDFGRDFCPTPTAKSETVKRG